MRKLIMCKGLPASGKSSWALEQVERSGWTWVRVNKDQIRRDLGKPWSRAVEKEVLNVRFWQIFNAFHTNKADVVISDDTNLAWKHESALRNIAKQCSAEFEVNDTFLQVPLDECIRRDSLRGPLDKVGEKVIQDMYDQFLAPPIQLGTTAQTYVEDDSLPRAIICDLDGTIAIHNNRSPYDFEKCNTDLPNRNVRSLLWSMAADGYQVVYLSGRDDSVQDKTKKWLNDYLFPAGPLYMRKTGDKRKDCIMKLELFDAHVRGKYNIVFCLDDRDQVVKLWRDMGLCCLQVNYGAF